jgi:hypothetical protein
MSSFNQVLIGGYPSGGLTTDKKPLMLADEAFSNLQNAYVFRGRVKKRDGSVSMGRLSRLTSAFSLGTSGASPWSFNIYTVTSITPEPNAEIAEGSVIVTIGTTVITDLGNGTLSQTGTITNATQANPCQITSAAHNLVTGNMVLIENVIGMTELNGNIYTITVVDANNFSLNGVDSTGFTAYVSGGDWYSQNNYGTINYLTGAVVITYSVTPAAAFLTFDYYPALPVMGICKEDVATIGIDQTIFFDTKYVYQFVAGVFQQLGTATWTGSNTDFFWSCNFQGADSSIRLFFATNNNITLGSPTPYDPIRYYPGPMSTWVDLTPLLTATITLYQALIVIPYYGRLLALNTWEGPTTDPLVPTGAVNFFARCRFSQIGNPTDQTLGWRTDVFGRGGFVDAPTNEAIVSAGFYKNTLIVFFEYSTWQLRYIGEYGLPFIFERISSDFGSTCTYSPIIFDQGVMTVGDRGVIQGSVNGAPRLDEQIPETVFSFEIQNNAPNFVHGVRDFEKEIVYWNYIDSSNQGIYQNFPNTVLVYNYRNNTWAQFRDSITCFGIAQFQLGITWDSLTTFWESSVTWDNVDDQEYVEYVTAGNQQGYITLYENPEASTPVPAVTLYPPTLSITAVNFSASPNILTVPNHNLANGEIIYITGTLWTGTDPGINNQIYNVTPLSNNTLSLGVWSQSSQSYGSLSLTSSAIYIGGGEIALFPKMNIIGKDFNPYQSIGKQFKLSYIDFQMDSNLSIPSIPAVTIQLFVNSYLGLQANLITGNQELINSSQQCGFITKISTSNPCIVTSPDHSLTTGINIYLANVQGMTQLINGNYIITVIDANNFYLNGVDSSGFSDYTKGGIWNTSPVEGQTYISGSQYAWYRFYSTQFGQYLRVALTYDDNLMNQLATHQTPMELNAMNLWFREGGRICN